MIRVHYTNSAGKPVNFAIHRQIMAGHQVAGGVLYMQFKSQAEASKKGNSYQWSWQTPIDHISNYQEVMQFLNTTTGAPVQNTKTRPTNPTLF